MSYSSYKTMDHHEYAEIVRSRGDLDPDQKKILIQDDLDRRKGNLNNRSRKIGTKDASEPESPTEDEFEPIETFEYNGREFTAGQAKEAFWVAQAGSEEFDVLSFLGPADSLEEIIESTERWQDAVEEMTEELFGELDEKVESGSVKVGGKEIMYTIRKDEKHGYHAQFHPPHGHESGAVDGFFETIEQAEAETVQLIKSTYP